MSERLLLTGNHAAAYGAMLARAEVISAYPITPQTMIVELLSELTASGRLPAKFITVESEHSAMAACGWTVTGGCWRICSGPITGCGCRAKCLTGN